MEVGLVKLITGVEEVAAVGRVFGTAKTPNWTAGISLLGSFEQTKL
jgi:hypothetical protein